jgi:hypothetical protein
MHRSGLSRNLVYLQQNVSFFDGGFETFISHELAKGWVIKNMGNFLSRA